MTVHRHPRPAPKRYRIKSEPGDNFVPYNEAFLDQLGKLNPRELVDRISNEGED